MNVLPVLTATEDCLYRVAVKAIIIKDDMVLLVQDNRDTAWTFPGGGVDYGETAKAAMKRELVEEIGITHDDIISMEAHPQTIIGHIKSGVPRCNMHFFVTVNPAAKLSPTQEVQKLAWVNINQLQNEEFDATAGPKAQILSLFNPS